MSINLLIGIGNAGTQIVKEASQSDLLKEVKMFTIDSVTNVSPTDNANITAIPIISDDKSGSGRSRERGAAMFEFHDQNGSFDELYKFAATAKSPILVVTSSAGGTGSGATPMLCKALKKRIPDCKIIPIIICPALKDPDAFHLNTTDLMLDLKNADIETYSIFRNEYGTANYQAINKNVVTAIEIILGTHYETTDLDSIDDSDLDMILSTPGRFIAVEAVATSAKALKHLITEKVLNGFQPAWTKEDAMNSTLMTAYSLASPFAKDEFEDVFSEIRQRLDGVFDEYRNICNIDSKNVASIIVAGLPRAELKQIDSEFQTATDIAEGIQKSTRPAFMNRKNKIRSVNPPENEDGSARNAVKWTK